MAFAKRSAMGYFMLRQGWVFALLVAAGLGLGAYEISAHQTVSRFASEGVDAVGQVTQKSDYSGRKGSNRTYRLSYSFPTPADPYTHGLQSVSEAFYDAQSEGADIVVRYLPSDPAISAVEPDKIAKGFWLGMAASIGLVLGGIAGGAFAMSRARACVTLRETGEVRSATVTGHQTEGKKKAKGHMLWSDASGTVGRTLTAPLSDLLPIGASITIFADPERRLKGVWEGDIGSR